MIEKLQRAKAFNGGSMRSYRVYILLGSLFLSGCQFWDAVFSDEPVSEGASDHEETSKGEAPEDIVAEAIDENADKTHVRSLSMEDLELKQAKLWGKINDLEGIIRQQKAQIKVLEKGLMLGLVPDELKDDSHAKDPATIQETPQEVPKNLVEDKHGGEGKQNHLPSTESESPAKPFDQKAYDLRLAEAHEDYRAGRYGQAIVAFSSMLKEFGHQAGEGAPHYWIGKSWASLKEFETAKKHFEKFVESFPGSPWVPRAKLDLARVEWDMGLRETALEKYRDIIKNYPYEDAAEMAKMELRRIRSSL